MILEWEKGHDDCLRDWEVNAVTSRREGALAGENVSIK